MEGTDGRPGKKIQTWVSDDLFDELEDLVANSPGTNRSVVVNDALTLYMRLLQLFPDKTLTISKDRKTLHILF